MSLKEKLQKVLFAIKKMPTVKKRFFALISAFIVLNIVFIILLFSVRHRSVLCLEEYGSNLTSRLYALNAPAKKAFVKEYETADFKFNDEQKAIFSKIYNDFETVALTVRLESLDSDFSEDSKFQFGYLTSEDFSSKGKLKENFLYNSRRILVQGKMNQASKSLDLSFALQKNDDIKKRIPEGFFVSASDCKLRILAACVVPAVLGYDCSSEVPFYGFACNGGIVQPGSKSFDFSGASMIFPVANSTKNTMPEFVVKLSEDPSLKASKERSVRAEIILGGEKFYVNNVALASEVRIPSAAMKAPFSRMDASNNSECLSGVLMRSTYLASPQVLVPIKTDPGLIVKYKSSAWRTLDYEIFEWDRFSKILFFDTRNYDIPQISEEDDIQTTREKLINGILNAELETGGWNYYKSYKDEQTGEDISVSADVDLTGMAIQALAPYYNKNDDVKASVDRALAVLSDIQDSSGMYKGYDGRLSSCSTAQVVCALSALNLDADNDERFVKEGGSALDALLAFYLASEKAFKNVSTDSSSDAYASLQVIYALTSYDMMKNEKGRLYDMSKVHQHKVSIQNVKESSCTEKGYTGDKVCDDCGEILEKGTDIAKLPHTPVEIPGNATILISF